MNGLAQDLRYAPRQLRKNPVLAAISIITLALGIGANSAIFSLANAVLFQQLPVRAANRLVVIWINNRDQTMSPVVRTALPPSAVLPEIKNAIWKVDKDQPIFNVMDMDEIVDGIPSAQRVAFVTLDAFALLALALAAIGIYGVTSYAVTQRIHEIGVRVGLGEQHGDTMSMVMLSGIKLWAPGF